MPRRPLLALATVLATGLALSGCAAERIWYRSTYQVRNDPAAPAAVELPWAEHWVLRDGQQVTGRGPDGVTFALTSREAGPVEVVWDECAFVDAAGRSHLVTPAGASDAERDQSQAPTDLLPGASLRAVIWPAGEAAREALLPTDAPPVLPARPEGRLRLALRVAGQPRVVVVPVALVESGPAARRAGIPGYAVTQSRAKETPKTGPPCRGPTCR